MDEKYITKYFLEACDGFCLVPGKNEISKFFEYKNLLISWNKKVNLTSITDEKEIFIKHFADSLTLCKFIGEGAKIIDVGTGAGFPGIPLKIMRPDIELVLLDSLNKRVAFLEELADKLGLEGVIVIHGRAEELARMEAHREAYDFSISRAVASLNVLAEYCMPFVKVGGSFLAMKGADIRQELLDAEAAIKLLGGETAKAETFTLWDSENLRTIVDISKIKETPERYPRRAGIPSKRPL